MRNNKITYCITLFICCIILSCQQKNRNQLFTSLSSNETRIKFSNDIDETKMPGDALNEFAYMGGGVLYLNKGNNHFEDSLLLT